MKKDRNTFFQESQIMGGTGFPNPNPNLGMNIANQPYTMSSYANQGYYAGPGNQAPMNYTTPNMVNANYNYDFSELEARLSKIERQINRIDARLNKLESGSFYGNDDMDNTTNVYMV